MPHPFRDEDFHSAIEAAVSAAEEKTAAEIVVVLADDSGEYGDVDAWWGATLAFLMLVFMVYAPFSVPEPVALLNVVVAYGAGFLLSRTVPSLRRWFTTDARRRRQVREAAQLAFTEEAVHATRARTGVLLYLSEWERRAVLLPDVGIKGRVEGAPLNELMQPFEAWTDPQSTTLAAITALGERLAGPFPADEDNPDEISNRPRVRR